MEEKSVDVLTPGPDESAIDERRYTGPSIGIERNLAEVLADVMGVERVSVDSHFFDDLGANSLVMAQFCARVRKRTDLPSASMKDIYRHPTIRSLTTGLANAVTTPAEPSVPVSTEVVPPAGTVRYALCGTLQFLLFLGYSFLAGLVADRGYAWVSMRLGCDRHLSAVVRLRRRRLRRPLHLPDRGQMAPHRPVEIARVPGLGSDVSAFLDRQGTDPRQPDDFLRRQSPVRAVPASPGRTDRQGGHDPLPQRSGLHRPAHDRRRRQ